MRPVMFDCTVWSSLAARLIPPSRATASKTRRSRQSIGFTIDQGHCTPHHDRARVSSVKLAKVVTYLFLRCLSSHPFVCTRHPPVPESAHDQEPSGAAARQKLLRAVSAPCSRPARTDGGRLSTLAL